MTIELSRSLEIDINKYREYTGELKIEERLKIWAETPIYSLRSYPLFGHRLNQFLHSSPNTQIAQVQIEFEIFDKLKEDFPYIRINNVQVQKIERNNYAATIQYAENEQTRESEINFFFDEIERASNS